MPGVEEDKEVQTLLKKEAVAHVRRLLERRGTLPAAELKEQAIALCDLARLSASWIKRGMPMIEEWLIITISLFDGAPTGRWQFYKDNGHAAPAPAPAKGRGRGRGKQTAQPKMEDVPTGPVLFAASKTASSYLIDVINAFNVGGGFEHLLRRLTEPTTLASALSIQACQHSVTLLNSIREHISPQFGSDLIGKFVPALHSRVSTLFEAKSAPLAKADLDRMLNACEELHIRHAATTHANQVAESFRVRLACSKMIGVREVFDKRVYGINLLNDMVERVQNNGKKGKEKESTKWMEPKHLTALLTEFKVVDTVLSADTHDEIVRRSSAMLCFLVGQGSLSPIYLERLWMWSQSENTHTAKISGDLLLELASLLNMDGLRYIYAKMESLSPAQYTPELMTQLAKFCEAALRNQHKKKADLPLQDEKTWDWFGLPLFWKAFQDDTKRLYRVEFAEAMQEQARASLGTLLKLDCTESQREMYIAMCMENVQRDQTVHQTIALCQTTLLTYPGQQVKQQWNTGGAAKIKSKLPKVGEAIILLESRFNLLGLLLDDLKRFKQRCRTEAKVKSVVEWTIPTITLPSNYDRQIEVRIKFLEYLFSSSQLMMSEAAVLVRLLRDHPCVCLCRSSVFGFFAENLGRACAAGAHGSRASGLAQLVSAADRGEAEPARVHRFRALFVHRLVRAASLQDSDGSARRQLLPVLAVVLPHRQQASGRHRAGQA